ncbi:MAG: hypothetical protein AAB336_12980 [Acidobacteriota bacterium]
MSFSIFAVGVTGPKKGGGRGQFNYSKDKCIDQGDFDPPFLLSIIPSSPDAAGVTEKIIGSPDSRSDDLMTAGISKIAEIEMAHLVMNAVDMLAINANGGKISVYSFQEKWYWADANNIDFFYLNSSSNPGRDFLKKIGPGLVKTELNNFGVLLQIAIAISKYESALPSNEEAVLNISLTH